MFNLENYMIMLDTKKHMYMINACKTVAAQKHLLLIMYVVEP